MSVASFPFVDRPVFAESARDSLVMGVHRSLEDSANGSAEEQRLAQSYGRHYRLPVFDPPADAPSPVDPSVGDLLCSRFCREHKLVPIATEADFIDIAVASPESLLLSEIIQEKTGRHMRPMFSPLSVVERLLATLYSDDEHAIDSSEFKPIDSGALDTAQLAKTNQGSSANVRVGTRPNRYLSDMLNSAIRSGASSLYFDIVDKTPRVRWRVNGELKDHDAPTTIELYDAMIDQVKRLAKIDNQTSKLTASGSFNLRRDGLCVNAIANVLQTQSGEQIVLKLRDSLTKQMDLSSIGLSIAQQRELQSSLQHSHGLILFVGPSRSGQTTTQYACLNGINALGLIRCTIENRISQTIPGALQLSMHAESQRGWSDAFDACAEHDPDLTLVERIEDRELATRCVLAGSLNQRILANVRATTSLQAIGHLRQLGVDHGTLADSLRCVVSQRLVRRLCEHCRQEANVPRELAVAFKLPLDSTTYQSQGCDNCHGSGYVGNVGIFEVLSIHSRLKEAIAMNASAGELQKLVRSSESVTIDGAAIEKLLVGETSVSEVKRAGLLQI